MLNDWTMAALTSSLSWGVWAAGSAASGRTGAAAAAFSDGIGTGRAICWTPLETWKDV